jgi:hypothetical protein
MIDRLEEWLREKEEDEEKVVFEYFMQDGTHMTLDEFYR